MAKIKVHLIRTDDFPLDDYKKLELFLSTLGEIENSGLIFKFYLDEFKIPKQVIRKHLYDFNKKKIDNFFSSEYFVNYFKNHPSAKDEIIATLSEGENITNWEHLFSICDKFRDKDKLNILPSDQVILLTNTNNELKENEKKIREYFGANEPSKLTNYNKQNIDNNSFVHTGHWELYLPDINKIYPISYMIILLIIIRKMGIPYMDFGKKHTHKKSIGCISDFTDIKADVILKIRSGDICDTCISLLQKKGLINKEEVPNEQIIAFLKILETIRDKTLFVRRALNLNNNAQIELISNESSYDSKMKYTKRNIYIKQFSNKPIKFHPVGYALYLYLLQNKKGFALDSITMPQIKEIAKFYSRVEDVNEIEALDEIREKFTKKEGRAYPIETIKNRLNEVLGKIIIDENLLKDYKISDRFYKINLDNKFIIWKNGEYKVNY